jgi:transcriptional regulator with XRE-family HTH domain
VPVFRTLSSPFAAPGNEGEMTTPHTPHTNPLADLGEFIKSQREVARLSVRRLAEIADVSNPYLSQIERGLRRPSAEILQQLARALKISVEALYIRAGLLGDVTDDVAPSVREAIGRDPDLTPEQKQALLNVYESFLK